jgi:hypothetical protein
VRAVGASDQREIDAIVDEQSGAVSVNDRQQAAGLFEQVSSRCALVAQLDRGCAGCLCLRYHVAHLTRSGEVVVGDDDEAQVERVHRLAPV